ncbi:MAG: deoxyribodipyrimidine photo-lyase [Acidimicrobiaceae bacterium]|nr:deoxyribodipyrimidine photo-lyase [Acidimicrobiaceae bacterium]MYE76969.1 deoxyribodipyrimidine photo-lyase [Acidimicrobiaceae bacterium]MYJ41817.1 deoxyribodipyrimidine photo-lyase [Acidimicrobiaceae bacterium]
MTSTALAWFRRDLRLDDNPAWASATARDDVVALVVLEPALLAAAGPWRRRAYLSAVTGLDRSLRSCGGSLRAETGDPAEVVPRAVSETGAEVVVVNADVTRWSVERDRRVEQRLGMPIEQHWGTLVHPPGSVLTRAGGLSNVLTPFHRRWSERSLSEAVRPGSGCVVEAPDGSTPTEMLGDGLYAPWGEQDAAARFETWLDRVDSYDEERDNPATDGTSGLSAALRFGLLSPRGAAADAGTHTPGRAAFVRQLAWRDWYAHLTFEHPDIDRVSLRPEYDRIAWAEGDAADADFEAWKAGRTGYPIVDAAMRELAATGWMHNRLRMVAASFLVKDLLIDWRRGERWFRRMLTDGDIPQNAGNWQWVAGTGPDAAPYFRVFNPVAQSRRHDPEGRYLRRWLPELDRLDSRAIHAPWQAAPAELAAAGVRLGADYPAPTVDHDEARERALAAYREALTG